MSTFSGYLRGDPAAVENAVALLRGWATALGGTIEAAGGTKSDGSLRYSTFFTFTLPDGQSEGEVSR